MSVENTHYGAVEIGRMLADAKSIFFIGIGGINMSSLAHISKLRGLRVGGSDRCPSALTLRLENEGISISYAHSEDNVEGYDAVVYTIAISPDNPEYLAAAKKRLPLISRADYMGYLMTGFKNRIGVSGMHGKSTCTSICATMFIGADRSPTVLSGAELALMGGAYCVGEGDDFVFEACEYMDSFLDFNPTKAVILNIETDHVDYFHSLEQIRRSFASFAEKTGKDGYAVFNFDDENVILALEGYRGHRVSFSKSDPEADYYAKNISYKKGRPCFDVFSRGKFVCTIRMKTLGAHNIYNALAALAVGIISGIEPSVAAKSISAFSGAARRMEYKGTLGGADVFDDYAHHPTEIKASLSSLKEAGYRKITCVFQSHTYSRTVALLDDFVESLKIADRVIVTDIYAARETNTLDVSPQKLAELVGDGALSVKSFEQAASVLKESAEPDEAIVIMGAGDVYKVFNFLELKNN